jgi:leucyl aminopeptidase
MRHLLALPGDAPTPNGIRFVATDTWSMVRDDLTPAQQAHADGCGFEPAAGRFLLIPATSGHGVETLFGIEPAAKPVKDLFLPGRLPGLLPAGTWRFLNAPHDERLAVLAWLMGSYRFTRYRRNEAKDVRLVMPADLNADELSRIAEAVARGRDLVNTPANDLGPAELDAAVREVAARHGATVRTITGDALQAEGFPLVHAVGRGSVRAPRLIDLSWGDPAHPKVTLIGKGVVFDTGGLDIKPEAAMLIMKKDMGGAAAALAAAEMVMGAGLPVRLRLIVPAVENAVSGSAFRPGDILPSRKGLSVEIGNTDAEGRLVLADALTLADADRPELVFDFATLTGAARVALGPELPPFYTDDDGLAAALARHAMAENDPLWRLPLWRPYEPMLDSKIADTNNVTAGGFAGSITAALFLRKFVEAPSWVHIDLYAWIPSARSARPEGGEVQAARAVYALLKERYPAA